MSTMLKEITHYALESIPSIYDEEALTALQLVGRVASKLNELIKALHELDQATAGTLHEFRVETIPEEVADRVQKLIDNGSFDKAIDLYAGELTARLNNILANGSPDKDPELVDARMDHRGYLNEHSWPTLGAMLRFWLAELEYNMEAIITWQTEPVDLEMILGYVNTDGQFIKEDNTTHKCATVDVNPGERFRLKTSYGYNMPSFVVQDADHYPIMFGLIHDGGTTQCNYEQVVTMPAGARYLIVNAMNGYFCDLQTVVGVNSNALDGTYITNALSGVVAGPIIRKPLDGKVVESHALKNGQMTLLESADITHRVGMYPLLEGHNVHFKTAVSFGCNPYVFRNKYGSVIGKLVTGPEDTIKEYDVTVRAPVGAVEVLVYFSPGYDAVVTVDSGCAVEAPKSNGYPDWSHLKWYAMGDSLTEVNDYASKRYYDYIREKTGIQVIVDGVGGTGYLAGRDEGKSFLDRVGNIPQDVDVITIFGSGNDLSALRALGKDSVDICEYQLETLTAIMGAHPGKPILVFAPSIWRGYASNNIETDTLDCYMYNYIEGLRGGAYNTNVMYYDSTFFSTINPNVDNIIPLFFSKDPTGVHPDENGHKALAPIFYNALASVLACKY